MRIISPTLFQNPVNTKKPSKYAKCQDFGTSGQTVANISFVVLVLRSLYCFYHVGIKQTGKCADPSTPASTCSSMAMANDGSLSIPTLEGVSTWYVSLLESSGKDQVNYTSDDLVHNNPHLLLSESYQLFSQKLGKRPLTTKQASWLKELLLFQNLKRANQRAPNLDNIVHFKLFLNGPSPASFSSKRYNFYNK